MKPLIRSLCFLVFILTACSKQLATESHSSVGVIVELRPRALVIQHEDFPGFMKAMTMPFDLADTGLARGLKVGDKVAFTLTKAGEAYPITEIHKLP